MSHNAHRYTRKRAELALEGYREHGSNRKAADTAGVCENTLRRWRKAYPEFEAAVQVALDECAERDGQRAVSAIQKHIGDYVEGRTEDVVVTEEGRDPKTGKPVHLRRIERRPVALNPTVLTRALTRYDTRFTHPKQEVEHSGSLTLEQSVADAAAKLDDPD